MTQTTLPRAAHYVGRVGVLAFGLGVWAVIANSPTAAADPESSHGAAAYRGASAPSATAARRARIASPGSTAFARRPALAYNAPENVQGAGGVISGTLNGSGAKGYPLSYSVTGAAQKGSVDVAGDGTFSYTPDRDFATLGGTDTFTVTADDRPGNARHWHGLSTLTAPNGGHTATAGVTVLENPGQPLPISVLATPDQLNAERLAEDLAGSPIVRLAALVLRAGWLHSAQRNYALVGGPDALNMARLDQAIAEYSTQAALEVQLLDSMNPRVIQQVASPHEWYQQDFSGSRIWYDNPDTIYRFIGVNSASSYVITGRFGGSGPDSLPADTNFSVLTGLDGNTAANLNGRDLVLNDDGSFTITANSSPAEPGQPNHLQLVAGTTLITTRNTLTDWNSQEPMSLSVTRISGPRASLFSQLGGFAFPGIGPLVAGSPLLTAVVSLIPPLRTPRVLQRIETAAIMLILGISGEDEYISVATTDPETGALRAPNTLSDPGRNAQFLSTQLQSTGYFQLADDQALVITIDPGNARYFNAPVTDDWTITGDYWNAQTSLNINQAVANPDGTYTLVVSPADPGVANWISTGGLNQGTISIRFQDFDPASQETPTVQADVVSLGQLGRVRRETTMYLTPEERQSQIAQRQLGYNRRYAPYPQA